MPAPYGGAACTPHVPGPRSCTPHERPHPVVEHSGYQLVRSTTPRPQYMPGIRSVGPIRPVHAGGRRGSSPGFQSGGRTPADAQPTRAETSWQKALRGRSRVRRRGRGGRAGDAASMEMGGTACGAADGSGNRAFPEVKIRSSAHVVKHCESFPPQRPLYRRRTAARAGTMPPPCGLKRAPGRTFLARWLPRMPDSLK